MRVSIKLLTLIDIFAGRDRYLHTIDRDYFFCSPVPRRWHRRPRQRTNWNCG